MSQYLEVPESQILKKTWSTFESFIRDVKLKPITAVSIDRSVSTHGYGRGEEWSGANSFDHAIEMAENGWSDGLSRIQMLKGELKPIEGEKADRHIAKIAESGDEVDIGRFVTNESECMIDFEIQQVPAAGRVAKMIIDVGSSSAFGNEVVFLKGASAVMLADLLEQSGLRSEIWITSCGENDGIAAYCFSVNLKMPDQPLELDRIVFAMSNAAMDRRLFFRAIEQITPDEFNKYIGIAYGRPRSLRPTPGDIFIEPLQYGFGNYLTPETVPLFVDKMLKSFMEA